MFSLLLSGIRVSLLPWWSLAYGPVLWSSVCAPPNSYVKTVTANVMALGAGAFRELIRFRWTHEGRPPWWTTVLIRRGRDQRAHTLCVIKDPARKQLFANQKPGSHQNLAMLAAWPQTSVSRYVRNECLLFNPLSLLLSQPKLTRQMRDTLFVPSALFYRYTLGPET